MAKAKNDVVPAAIEFETREVDGENKVFVLAPWPALAVFGAEALATCEFAKADGDELKIAVANGAATYKKFSTGVDAREDEVFFKLVDSAFEPLADEEDVTDNADDQDDMVLDTRAEAEEAYKRTRLSDTIVKDVREAMKTSDMQRHAGLHALESAFGDFKRACTAGAAFYAEDSSERAALLEIVDEL
jgi:hypothetical protein